MVGWLSHIVDDTSVIWDNVSDWVSPLIAAITGGVIWEGFKFLFPDIKHWINSYRNAKKELNSNIDPILKSADELYGKISSLSKEDFATFINPKNSISENVEENKQYIYFLFGQFWAHLEIIRMKSQYTSIAKIKKGEQLIKFIETFEARDFRILDRSIQRMIGEGLIENAHTKFKTMSLNQFITSLKTPNSPNNLWIKKLEDKLMLTSDIIIRQRILVFGVILDSLINHYDPKSKIVRNRKIYMNKLNRKSKKMISSKLFNPNFALGTGSKT